MMRAQLWFFLAVLWHYGANTEAATSYDMMVTCDDHTKVYFDGVLQPAPQSGLEAWNIATHFTVPGNTQVIGIECWNGGGASGIVATFSNGIATDGSWYCSSQHFDDWSDPSFNIYQSTWQPATEIGPYGTKPWRGMVSGMSGSPMWIWTSKYHHRGDRHVFCRKDLDKPTTAVQEPTTAVQEPTTAAQEPTTAAQEPTTAVQESNPCDSSPCANGTTCLETGTGDFYCLCPQGVTGPNCDCPYNDALYLYGEETGDDLLTDCDDCHGLKHVPHGIQVFCYRYRKLWVGMNGFVSLEKKFIGIDPPAPEDLEEELVDDNTAQVVLAPLWADWVGGVIDSDDRNGTGGTLLYNSYTKWSEDHNVDEDTNNILQEAQQTIRTHAGISDFIASNVIIVTWSGMSLYWSPVDEEHTFQLAIISDHRTWRTYAQFNYMGHNCQSDPVDDYNAILTFARKFPSSPDHTIDVWPLSDTPQAFEMATTVGNVGVPGMLLYDLSDEECLEPYGPEWQCRVWAIEQMNNWGTIRILVTKWQEHYPCPCTLQEAIVDPNYSHAGYDLCFVSTHDLVNDEPAQRCCYDPSLPTSQSLTVPFLAWGTDDVFLMTREVFQAGSFTMHNELSYPTQYQGDDAIPKENCCLKSDQCNLYFRWRPIDSCENYQKLT